MALQIRAAVAVVQAARAQERAQGMAVLVDLA
jgi:hypothetical protein